MRKIIIFGNQAISVEAYHALASLPEHTVVAFAVDAKFIRETTLLGLPVVPFESLQVEYAPHDHWMFIAVGYVDNNKLRASRLQQAKEMGYKIVSITAPTAINSPGNVVGENCLIGHYSTISPNVRIGNNVIIGNHCSIGHDAVIGDNCFLSNDVAISGRVTVGAYSYLGTNCTIRNGVTIAPRCVIGAGALVLENTEERGVYLGAAATLLPISSEDLTLG